MTTLFHSIPEWRTLRQSDFFAGKKLGFVPTMGNLHRGHQSLLERSIQENDLTLLSIFVNPTQFDNPDDLKKYPQTLEQDIKMANEAGVDFILCPNYTELYPDNYRYKITESEFSKKLCGAHRPGHFDGMLTVVMKLLQLAQAQHAYFGEKDFQQLQLVKNMVDAFFIDTKIIACPTVRDEQGLALSSRNSRLTADEYKLAIQFPKLLKSNKTPNEIAASLIELGFAVDYIEDYNGRRFGAAHLGQVRLIDNILIEVN